MIIVLVKNLESAHLGYPAEMGLLYPAGSRLDTLLLLPHVEKKLLSEGFAVSLDEWRRQANAKRPPVNKRRRPYAVENKAK